MSLTMSKTLTLCPLPQYSQFTDRAGSYGWCTF